MVDADTDIIRLVLDDGWTWNVMVDSAYLRLSSFGPLYGSGFTAQYWTFKLLQTGETKVNVNSATANELDALPGIGPATAAAIVRARTAKPFASAEELQTRGLVSPKVFADLRDLVTVR